MHDIARVFCNDDKIIYTPKLRWKDTVRRDMKIWNIREEWATDRERQEGRCKTRYLAQGDGDDR